MAVSRRTFSKMLKHGIGVDSGEMVFEDIYAKRALNLEILKSTMNPKLTCRGYNMHKNVHQVHVNG